MAGSASNIRTRILASSKWLAILSFGIAVILILILWLTISTQIERNERERQELAQREGHNLAVAIAEETDRALESVDQILRIVAYATRQERDNLDLPQFLSDNRLDSDIILQVAIVNEHGKVLQSTVQNAPTDVNIADRSHFIVHAANLTSGLYISVPTYGKISHHWTLQMSRAIRSPDGAFRGVVVASVDSAYFHQFYHRMDIGYNGEMILVGLDGGLRSVSTVTGDLAENNIKQTALFEQILTKSPGFIAATDPVDNAKRLYAAQRLSKFPMVILIGFSEPDLFADIDRHRQSLVTIGSIVSFAIVGVLLLLYWQLQHQISVELKLRHTQRIQSMGRLAGGLAHDLKNKYAVIAGNLQYVRDLVLDFPEALVSIDTALSAASASSDLVGGLLSFARKQTLAPRLTTIAERVTTTVTLCRPAIAKSVPIIVNCETDIGPVFVDPVQFDAVLTNLLTNSADAIGANGGTITVTIGASEEQPEFMFVQVSDTGCGIAKRDLPHVFEPFFTTKETGKGTGLGLSAAAAFAEQSHGKIEIKSKLAEGTTVRLLLPCAVGSKQFHAEQEPICPIERREPIRVLLVEDEDALRHATAAFLTRRGFEVVELATALDAINLLASKAPVDVIFTDVVTPGPYSGMDLAVEAQKHQPPILVLMTSGAPDVIAGHPLDSGVSLLPKPYDLDGVCTTIADLWQPFAIRRSHEAGRASSDARESPGA